MTTPMSIGNSQQSLSPQNQIDTEIIADASSSEGFTLGPNETKSVTIQLVIADAQVSLPVNFGNIIPSSGMISIGTRGLKPGVTYELHVTADVDGIALDPGTHQSIQIQQNGSTPTTAQTTPGIVDQQIT